MLNQVKANDPTQDSLIEKVILGNDLSGLSPIEKVNYVKNICHTIGLNPVTRPIQIMKFQGKEIPYFSKDATEQLRKLNQVSLSIKEAKVIDDVYVVIAEAEMPNGRKDSSTGAVLISGLKGEAKANAIMKAETKAKRRVTLSICGLGFMDESEISVEPAHKPSPVKINAQVVNSVDDDKLSHEEEVDLKCDLKRLEEAKTLEELQESFSAIYKSWIVKRNKAVIKMIIDTKDKRKDELNVKEFNDEIDADTGEVT